MLVVGLGCEGLEPLTMLQSVEELGKPSRGIVIQEEGGSVKAIAQGVAPARAMADQFAAHAREAVPPESLILGLECGGSDATSGLAANPALGEASDSLIALGGNCILSETTESIGAEHVLARRAVNDTVGQQLIAIVRACEERALRMGEDLRGSQPTPGNIAGGISRRTADRMADNIDLDLSGVIEGTLSIEEAGGRILDEILAVAGGKLTNAEQLGHTEFSIYRVGPTF